MINFLATSIIGTVIAKILLSLGLGFVSYTGFTAVLDIMETYVHSAFDGLPSSTVMIMGLIGLDQFISLFFSAWSTVFMFRTFKSIGWFV